MSNLSSGRPVVVLAALIACVTVSISVSAGPGQSSGQTPTPTAAPCAAAPLAGAWKVQSMTMDGKPSGDPEMSTATITFSANRLTIETVGKSANGLASFTFKVEPAASPCALHVTPSDKSAEPAGWMLFAIEKDTLRLGFHDNLSRRPASFDARPNMVVLQLSRAGKNDEN